MKKLLIILLSLIVIATGIGYLAWSNSTHILSFILSKKIQVPVTVESLDFEKDFFSILQLQVSNPKGARLPTALKVETIDVKAPYKNYIENPIVIEEIHLDNLYLNIQIYDKDQTTGNWHTLLANIQEDHSHLLSIEREALIKKLLLTNIRIDLILSDGKLHELSPIKKIEFDNVTTEKGIPIQEISEIIVQKMMHSIFLQKGLKTIIEAPVNIIKGIFPFFGDASQKQESTICGEAGE